MDTTGPQGGPCARAERLTRMTLRQLPGALILGLLASLIAHAVAFSDGHAQGGAYHNALTALAAFGGVGFLLVAGYAAVATAGPYAQGSVIAARLSSLLPGNAAIGLSALGWFAATESLESAHTVAPLLLVAVLLALTTFAMGILAHVALRAIAALAIAIRDEAFAARRPVFARRAYVAVRAQHTYIARHAALRAPPGSVGLRPIAHPAL
jgi:hypothetical protein